METPLGNTIEALRAASSGKHWITACARLRVYAFQANHPHWCVYVCMSVRVNESEGSVGREGESSNFPTCFCKPMYQRAVTEQVCVFPTHTNIEANIRGTLKSQNSDCRHQM